MFPRTGGEPRTSQVRQYGTKSKKRNRQCAGAVSLRCTVLVIDEDGEKMTDRKPDMICERKVKGTTYIISSFFNPDATETAAEKMGRIIERELSGTVNENKNLSL